MKAIIVEARERGSEAILEINVQPIIEKGDRINCGDYVQVTTSSPTRKIQ